MTIKRCITCKNLIGYNGLAMDTPSMITKEDVVVLSICKVCREKSGFDGRDLYYERHKTHNKGAS